MVMTLLGILITIALPATRILETVRADMAERRALHALQYAQSVALGRNRSTWIRFNEATDTCEAFVEDPLSPGLAGRLPLRDPLAGGPLVIDLAALGGDVVRVDFGGANELEFDRDGLPRASGGTALVAPGHVQMSIGTVEVIDGTGLVRLP